jgi:hypothetical protein
MPSARHPRRVAHTPIGPFVTPHVRCSPACPEALQLGGGHQSFVSEAGSLSDGDHVLVLGGHVEADAVPGPAVVPVLVALCDGFQAAASLSMPRSAFVPAACETSFQAEFGQLVRVAESVGGLGGERAEQLPFSGLLDVVSARLPPRLPG